MGDFGHLGGVGKTRLRNVPVLAPNNLKIDYGALVIHLQPMPEHPHRLFCFGHSIGANGAATHEGANLSPILTIAWGAIPPQKTIMYYPLWTTFLPLLTKTISIVDQF